MAEATRRRGIAIELNNLAFLLYESNHFNQASTVFQEALQLMEAQDISHADGSLKEKDSLETWERKLRQHQGSVEGLCGRRDPSNSLDQIVDIYACQFEKIIRAIMRPITLHEKFTADASFPDAVVSMVIQHNMGIVHFRINELDEAVKHFVNAASRKEMVQDKNFSSLYLSIQCGLGITYARLERLEEALQALTVALTFRMKYGSNKNSSHAAMLQELGDFHGAMGSDGLAYTFFLGEMLVSCEHQPIYCGPQIDCVDTASAAA